MTDHDDINDDVIVSLHITIDKYGDEFEVYWDEDCEGTFATEVEAKAAVVEILSFYLKGLKRDIAKHTIDIQADEPK